MDAGETASSSPLPPGSWVAIFHSLHRVMAAEAALVAARLSHRLLSTPRPLTSTCGLAIVLPPGALDEARTVLRAVDIEIVELHRRLADGYEAIPTDDPTREAP